MLLYTWKDVKRKLFLNKEKWGTFISDIETYTDEIIIRLEKETAVNDAKRILNRKIFKCRF